MTRRIAARLHTPRHRIRSAALAILTALAALCAPARATDAAPPAGFPDEAAVKALLAARIAEGRAKGLAVVLIAPQGAPVFIQAGDSGNTARPQIEPDTIFEIGSITKTFTGTALAQMEVEGLVKPGDRIRDHAPAGVTFPPGTAGDSTLLQLATHTSGLPRLPLGWTFLKSMLSNPENPYANYSRADMWAWLADRKLDAGQAHAAAYSNLGMGVLGELLANRAAMSYGELIHRRITRPLAMTDTAIETPGAAQNRLAIGHTKKLKPTAYWSLPAMAGAGALRSTPRDMAKYLQAQQHGSLVGARLAQEPRARMCNDSAVGYGWLILTAKGDEIVWHNGGTGGFRSFAGFSRKTGKAVIVLSNSEHDVDDLALHLLNPAFKLKAKD